MVDKVKPLKLEDATSGTQVNPFPKETDPTQDYISGKGLALENLDTHLIDRSGNNIQFTDPTLGTKTVTQLRTDIDNSFDGSGATPTFTATDVRNAIIEARDTAAGTAARFGVTYGYSANAKNKWIDYFSGISSDASTFIAAESLTILAITASSSSSTSGEIEVYKNGTTLIYTVTFVAQNTIVISGLSIAIASGDSISAKVSNTATISTPVLTLFMKVNV